MLLKPWTKPGSVPTCSLYSRMKCWPGQGEHSLDDHVVERHGLDQRHQVLGLAREVVDSALEHLVEQLVELRVDVRAGLGQPVLEVGGLEHADLVVEAVEEAHVAGLVGDLRAEEDAHLLARRGAHHRAELLGDLLLADEERRQPVHALEALLLRDALVPVDAVLGEVDVLRRPLLAFPEVVELLVAEQMHLAPIGGFQQPGIAGRLEVVAVGSVGDSVAHAGSVPDVWLASQSARDRARPLPRRPLFHPLRWGSRPAWRPASTLRRWSRRSAAGP